VIVGARVAGAATALLLARRGLSVLAVDRSAYGSDTLSTHALMRGGVVQLHRWGVLDAVRAASTPPIRTTYFHYGDEVVEVAIAARDGVDALYAPRRTVLDVVLEDAARRAGADIVHGPRLVDLIRTDGEADRVRGVVLQDGAGAVARVQASIVIGADGLKSTVARLVGARPYHSGQHACGVIYGYWAGVDVGGNHWYYRPNVSAGAIPTNEGLTCVFAAAPRQRFMDTLRFDLSAAHAQVLHESAPALAADVARARRVGILRGFAGEPGYIRQSWGPGWALVGDAAYFRDPLTAHGITDALRDAEILARAVAERSDRALAEYQACRDELAVGLFRASDDIASFAWDLPAVKARHLFMSREMSREVAWLLALDRAGAAAADAGAGDVPRAAGPPGLPGSALAARPIARE
jgi:2-polyprenyl-6-methoxyphenol hydroxylase-like FAD-dependent oxidoreductase